MSAWWTTIGEDGKPSPAKEGEPERADDELAAGDVASPAPPAKLGTSSLRCGDASELVGSQTRRTFLEVVGFGAAAVTLASCEAPMRKALPLVAADEQTVPGKAVWFASTCGGCSASCGTLVKTRDGRPIKIEGNPDHPVNGHPRRAGEAARTGALCASGQAISMSLYDASRPLAPRSNGQDATWDGLDVHVREALADARRSGKRAWLLTEQSASPSTALVVETFCERMGVRHGVWDPFGPWAIAEAHRISHGRAVVPVERLDEAAFVLSLGADLLGSGHSPAEHTRRWSAAHRPDRRARRMGRWAQLEGRMSVTGAYADERHRVAPSHFAAVLRGLLRRLAPDMPELSGTLAASSTETTDLPAAALTRLASELDRHRGRALVVCDAPDVDAQLWVNALNEVIGAYGTTLDLASPRRWTLGQPEQTGEMLADMEAGRVGVVIVWGANPIHDWPDGERARRAFERVPVRVAIADAPSETVSQSTVVAAAPNALESWTDAEPRLGVVAIAQPAMRSLGRTRSGQESLLRWMGDDTRWLDWLRRSWAHNVFPRATGAGNFTTLWDATLERGFAEIVVPRWELPDGTEPRYGDLAEVERASSAAPAEVETRADFDARAVAGRLSGTEAQQAQRARRVPDGLELSVHTSAFLRSARDANNPWLQELPDPISKVCWTNHASISPAHARREGLRDGDLVVVSRGSRRIELPVIVQPGQHDRVVSIAAGYGRRDVGPVGRGVGANGMSLLAHDGAHLDWIGASVLVHATGSRAELPRAQTEAGAHERDHVRTASFEELIRDPRAGNRAGARHLSIWPGHRYEGHRWAMAIDLSACTGCNGCVVACQVENNVPVVGPDEIARNREMTWLRIDRYYGGEDPDRPEVVHQPMMCQHCENAPCETVCPVLATVHSEEGLNQQVYNRCVGTRYCANNCPYKARRFNWFDYPHDDDTARLALNPDVVVRSRGVMEKCTFCVQRIQEAKWQARRDGRPLADGDVQPACAQSCPARAIVFGDLHDPDSEVSRLVHGTRSYRALHELNVIPSVSYLTRIKNTGEAT